MAKKVNVKRLKSDIWTRLSVLEERSSIGSSDSRKTSLMSEQTDGEGAVENLFINKLCQQLLFLLHFFFSENSCFSFRITYCRSIVVISLRLRDES